MNFGSKLNRVKLQADRLFLRGDRTDVVGELRYAEEHAEELRVLCEAFARSLEKRLNTHMVTEEKKHRKVPENQVAEILKDALKEASQNPQDDITEKSLFKTTIEEVVAVEQLIGKEILDYEDIVEVEVLTPIHKLLRDDFPSIAKQKKALKQAGQDVDAAKARVRSLHSSISQPNKMESYKEELDEAESKLEQIRDSYACDLFSVMGKQREITRLCNLYLEMKVEHLQKSLQRMNTVLPPIRKILENSNCSPVYGVPLYEHLRITQQEIALPIQVCVRRLISFGMFEEGLLRVAGSSTKIRRLKGLFDAGIISVDTSFHDVGRDCDVHVVAGAFKSYLRELPEPLLTHTKHDELVEAVRLTDHKEKLRHLWLVVKSLPTPNHNNLRYVVKFLAMLASFSAENKMTPNNISIVMAPNLVGAQRDPEGELATLGRNMTLGNDYRVAVELLIEYADYFFKEEVDFGVTPRRPEPPPSPKAPLQVTNGTHIARTASHRRTESTDLSSLFSGQSQQTHTSSSTGIPPESESPKQPHRMKKKPAPLPPQGETASTFPLSHSPELARSKTPPANSALSGIALSSNHPCPAPRLQYTNSLRRPTAEPPKPPAGTGPPAKPPRPSPPTVTSDAHSEAKENKPPRPSPPVAKEEKSNIGDEALPGPVAPIGFENLEGKNPTDTEIVLRNGPTRDRKGGDRETALIGFQIEESDARPLSDQPQHGDKPKPAVEVELRKGGSGRGGTDEGFRKSLEGMLKHQPQTRHLVKLSQANEATTGDTPQDNKLPIQLPVSVFPVPALRSMKEITTTDKPEPAPRSDKPAIPEKPTTISRVAPSGDHSRPVIPTERPHLVQLKPTTPSASLCQGISRSNEKLMEVGKVESEQGVSEEKTEPVSNQDMSCSEKPSRTPKPHPLRSSLESEVTATGGSEESGEGKGCSSDLEASPSPFVNSEIKPDTTHL